MWNLRPSKLCSSSFWGKQDRGNRLSRRTPNWTIERQWHKIKWIEWMRTQLKRDKLFWSTCYEISDHFRHSFSSTLLDLTRAIDPWDDGYDLESQQPSRYTRECLTVLRARTHDAIFRKGDSNLLKEFRRAFFERAAGTFVLMHILFSFAMSRTIFYYDVQLSRWSNFDPLTHGELRATMEN